VTLTKHLLPADDSGRFDLKLTSSTGLVRVVKTGAGEGDSGTIQVAPGTWTVLESPASGTSLGDYGSSISCTRNGNPGPSGNGTSLEVTLAASDVLACTITNQHT
jgi:Prealbumin-like fold domain